MSSTQTFLLSLLLLLTVSAAGQDTLVSHFNSEWKPCEQSEADYSFYRKIYQAKKKLWNVRDFFASGALQMQGYYLDAKAEKKHGDFVWYYETGEESQVATYKKGLEIGASYYYYKNGKLSKDELHKKGKLIMSRSYDEQGVVLYSQVPKMPDYNGGQKGLFKFLAENVRYPEEAKKARIGGKVYISFVVEKDGSVSEIRILRGIGWGCDQEAIRVVEAMGKWTPAQYQGKLVRFRFNLPLKFTLR